MSSVIGKVFEHVILGKIESNLPEKQSSLQFGFTKGLSPLMAALILSETVTEGMENNLPVYSAYLDTQKAFDVVDHNSLKCKLFHQDINHHIWKTIDNLYSVLSSKVRWKGETSQNFRVMQGVRQGGILSTGLYKVYINDLLLSLEKSGIGTYIGTTYTGCPTVADDLTLLNNQEHGVQDMLDITYRYANRERYIIHPEKSLFIRRYVPRGYIESFSDWRLGDSELTISTDATHVGIIRSSEDELGKNVDERISCARRTFYSMTYTGLHGSNGLTPSVCFRIYSTYVLPRLLYGLEINVLLQKHLVLLENFHISMLRLLQGLPKRTPRCISYLLLGARPLQAEIHIRQLTFLGNIIRSGNLALLQIMKRQITLKDNNSKSWFVYMENLVDRYELSPLDTLMSGIPPKSKWKKIVQKHVEEYWIDILITECKEKSTLSSCNIDTLRFGKLHNIWKYHNKCLTDVRRGHVKARLLTSTYIVQSKLARFNQNEVDPTCQFCRRQAEDYKHMILFCGALHTYRKPHVDNICILLYEWTGRVDLWNSLSSDDKLQLVLDVSVLVNAGVLPAKSQYIEECEYITKKLCYSVHCGRLYLQGLLKGRRGKGVGNT